MVQKDGKKWETVVYFGGTEMGNLKEKGGADRVT